MKGTTNYSIKHNEKRDKLYSAWLKITEDKTFAKAIDGAVEIANSLYENSGMLASEQLRRIVPERYLTKFLLKETKRSGDKSG